MLYEPYAALGAEVGFIYGTIAVLSVIFAFFFVPDCSGRRLEEIDWLFESGVPLRKFAKTDVPEVELQMTRDDTLKTGAVRVRSVEDAA